MQCALELTKLLNSVYKVIELTAIKLFHCFNIKVYIHNAHKNGDTCKQRVSYVGLF